MKNLKKLIASLLAVMMLITMIPAVSEEEIPVETEIFYDEEPVEEAEDEGELFVEELPGELPDEDEALLLVEDLSGYARLTGAVDVLPEGAIVLIDAEGCLMFALEGEAVRLDIDAAYEYLTDEETALFLSDPDAFIVIEEMLLPVAAPAEAEEALIEEEEEPAAEEAEEEPAAEEAEEEPAPEAEAVEEEPAAEEEAVEEPAAEEAEEAEEEPAAGEAEEAEEPAAEEEPVPESEAEELPETFDDTVADIAATGINCAAATIGIGEEYFLNASLLPEGASGEITYTYSATAMKYVTPIIGEDGAVGSSVIGAAAGTASITLTCGSIKKTVKITVKKAPTKITLTPAKKKLVWDDTVAKNTFTTLKTAFTGGSWHNIEYTIEPEGIIQLEDNKITALATGTATITATQIGGEGISGSCEITVVNLPHNIGFKQDTAKLAPKATLDIQALLDPDQMDFVIADYPVTWTTSNKSIATVSAKGVVTGVKAGTAVITVKSKSGDAAAEFTVNVKDVDTIVFGMEPGIMGFKEVAQLTATAYDDDGDVLAAKLTYSSSNTKAAKVASATGVVTALSKAGDTVITAKSTNGKTATLDISVVDLPGTVTIGNLTLGEGEVSLLPACDREYYVTFDNDGAHIDDSAIVADNAGVTAYSVYFNDQIDPETPKATGTITVKEAPNGIQFANNESELVLFGGETYTLKAVQDSPSGYQFPVAWFTDGNPSLLTCKDGKLTVPANITESGEVIISASLYNCSVSCIVTVYPAPKTVTLPIASVSLTNGEAFQLTGDVFDAAGNNLGAADIQWKTSKATLANIDETGYVTAAEKGTGTVTITATAYNPSTGTAFTKIKATAKVNVKAKPTAVKLPAGFTLMEGETKIMAPTFTASKAGCLLDWSSGDTAIATVDEFGYITGTGDGTCEITVTGLDGAISDTVSITVTPRPDDIALKEEVPEYLYVGKSFTLAGTVIDEYGATTSYPFTLQSTDATVMTISGKKITGKAAGEAELLLLSNGVEFKRIPVTVYNVPASIRLFVNGEETGTTALDLPAGCGFEIEAHAFDKNGTEIPTTYTYTTSNKKIATVDADGIVTGVAANKTAATITVKSSNGKSKTVKFKVGDALTEDQLFFDLVWYDSGETYEYSEITEQGLGFMLNVGNVFDRVEIEAVNELGEALELNQNSCGISEYCYMDDLFDYVAYPNHVVTLRFRGVSDSYIGACSEWKSLNIVCPLQIGAWTFPETLATGTDTVNDWPLDTIVPAFTFTAVNATDYDWYVYKDTVSEETRMNVFAADNNVVLDLTNDDFDCLTFIVKCTAYLKQDGETIDTDTQYVCFTCPDPEVTIGDVVFGEPSFSLSDGFSIGWEAQFAESYTWSASIDDTEIASGTGDSCDLSEDELKLGALEISVTAVNGDKEASGTYEFTVAADLPVAPTNLKIERKPEFEIIDVSWDEIEYPDDIEVCYLVYVTYYDAAGNVTEETGPFERYTDIYSPEYEDINCNLSVKVYSRVTVFGTDLVSEGYASAEDMPQFVSGDFVLLTKDAQNCAVVKYNGSASTVTVSDKYNNLAVDEICDDAFTGNTALTAIKLPATVKRIGKRAFKGCTNLSSMS